MKKLLLVTTLVTALSVSAVVFATSPKPTSVKDCCAQKSSCCMQSDDAVKASCCK